MDNFSLCSNFFPPPSKAGFFLVTKSSNYLTSYLILKLNFFLKLKKKKKTPVPH